MVADPNSEGLEGPEALREVILAQRGELGTLRRETADVALLIDALEALLQVRGDEDPLAGVFAILQPVLRFSHGLVLAEHGEPGSPLHCIAATAPALIDSVWDPSRLLDKVLAGRVTATVSNGVLGSWPRAAIEAGLVPTQSALCLPVRFRDRRGLMMLLRPIDDEGFDRRHIALARKFSLLASHAFATRSANRSENERRRLHRLTEELKAAQATLAHRANHDHLTGLPNRTFSEEHIARALSRAGGEQRLALAFVDLDGFKQVNDLHGHQVGDGLLKAVADRIRGEIRSTDMLARISGDEFVLLVDPLAELSALDTIIERILVRLKEAFTVRGIRIMLSASIGLAIFPEHGADYEELQRNADMAMYSAKSTERGSAAYFDVRLGRAAAERLQLEQVIRQAVRERRFRPALQPLIDLRTMDIVGFEALARRVGDDGLLRAPGEFIDLANQLGLLDAITDMLVDDLIATLPVLDACFGDATTISINVSARQATNPDWMRTLLGRLDQAAGPKRFVIELTEDAFLQTDIFQQQVLPLFGEFGIRVSIDDFGTGYSSMSMLLELTAHELKIDRAFVTGVHERPRSQVILQGIANAGHQLGVSIVAEGVETEAELQYLRSKTSITVAQGFLFARPMLVERLVDSRAEITDRLRALGSVGAVALR